MPPLVFSTVPAVLSKAIEIVVVPAPAVFSKVPVLMNWEASPPRLSTKGWLF